MQNTILVRGILIFLLMYTFQLLAAGSVLSEEEFDFELFVGKWVRIDAEYVIHVRNVKKTESIDVGYFNPNKINISKASVSEWKGMGKLFIKLRDKGYPGSTYTLYYNKEKDAMAGFYYQAAMDETFEVVFVRKK